MSISPTRTAWTWSRRTSRSWSRGRLSKSYALAGLRFGYLVAQPQLIQQLIKVKDSYNCDALSIAGATAAIDDQAWLRQNVAKIRATRRGWRTDWQTLGFARHALAGQLRLVHPPEHASPSRCTSSLKQNRVLVRYMNYPGWGDGLRISVGTRRPDRGACLALLKAMV